MCGRRVGRCDAKGKSDTPQSEEPFAFLVLLLARWRDRVVGLARKDQTMDAVGICPAALPIFSIRLDLPELSARTAVSDDTRDAQGFLL